MTHVATPEHIKAIDTARKETGSRMCDNIERKDVKQVALLALTQKDIDALNVIADDDGRIKNYSVLIRRLISREAKACAARSSASGDRSSVPSVPVIPGQTQIPY